MKPGRRFGLSAIEKSEVWKRWKAGETLHEIGRAFDKPHTSIRHLLLPRGGIPPALRRRSRLALTRSEREDISRGVASGSSIREIASRPRKNCVQREISAFCESFCCVERDFFALLAPHACVSGARRDTTTPTYCAGTAAAIRFRMRTRL